MATARLRPRSAQALQKAIGSAGDPQAELKLQDLRLALLGELGAAYLASHFARVKLLEQPPAYPAL